MNQEIEITYQEAKALITDPHQKYEFDNLNESTIDDNVEFEQVQNRRYFIEKTGRKGSLINLGYGDEKAENGAAKVTMQWDFRHPTNFTQNENNLRREFQITL